MTEIRFSPPEVDLQAEVDWLLGRAFGAAPRPFPAGDLDIERVVEIGQRFSLLSRIRSRHSEEDLCHELDLHSLGAFDQVFYSNVAMVLRHEAALRDIAKVSSDNGQSIILLKGMALHMLGRMAAGSRRVTDIDILVPVTECQLLYDELQEAGFRPSGIAAPDHHLSVLFHPSESALEIHHVIDGVRMNEQGFATAESCLRNDQVEELSDFPANCYLPSRSLLVAQLLAHGLAHHGKAPDSYPSFQLLADLQDLGLAQSGGGDVGHEVESWLSRDVSPEEIQAALDLTWRLSTGERSSDIAREDSGCAVLLRHFVAGALDPIYLESLKLSRKLDPSPGRGRLESVLRTASSSIWLSDLQVDMLYGKRKSPACYFFYRLWRPFDLILRLMRYSRSWLVIRYRSRR